jgi:hypothetical protein
MATKKRRPSAPWAALAVAALAVWPSCGGKSIRVEDDGQGDGDSNDDSGVGGGPSGGVGGTQPAGGVSFGGNVPQGGVGATPNGGVGPTGGVGNAPSGGFSGAGFGGVGPMGGVGGIGPGGTSGRGGFAGMGGFGGVGGRAVGGRGGRGGRGGFSGAGGIGGVAGIGGSGGFAAHPMDGFTFQTPCNAAMGITCMLAPMGCPMGEMGLLGVHPTDVLMVMPGTPGVFYDLTIHFQGLVESKVYTGGVDQDGYSSIVPADGLYTGGVPAATPEMLYLVRVASPARDYYLNSISPPSMSSIRPPTAVDFRATIRVEGGTTVRLVSADSDCSALRNCGTTSSTGACVPATVANLDPKIGDDVMQPVAGQFIGMVIEAIAVVVP